jgi:hypothetical protein
MIADYRLQNESGTTEGTEKAQWGTEKGNCRLTPTERGDIRLQISDYRLQNESGTTEGTEKAQWGTERFNRRPTPMRHERLEFFDGLRCGTNECVVVRTDGRRNQDQGGN